MADWSRISTESTLISDSAAGSDHGHEVAQIKEYVVFASTLAVDHLVRLLDGRLWIGARSGHSRLSLADACVTGIS